MTDSVGTSPVEVLRRWEDSGATWRVVSRADDRLRISLRTCTGDEEMDRIDSADPDLIAYVAGRTTPED